MDKQQIRQFLETVAEVEDVKPATNPNFRLDENSGGEVKYNGEWVEVGKTTNPTLGFRMVGLKPVEKICSLGCGKTVKNQIIEKRLCEHPVLHWRTKCQTCSSYVGPDGVGFIEGGHSVQAAFVKHFRNKNK